ncbi:hypothetical protein [Hathewaya limosa]|uniref:Uncharacterized protein n=1 Tax=Hathewaya limosa TaxID=1536 RepID=A0ABU0JUA9_HATLI|nr:hypothetical protein [Hathewaya limosa]MDQ0480690.1 hypothetical protein [Hathewaya limosa]
MNFLYLFIHCLIGSILASVLHKFLLKEKLSKIKVSPSKKVIIVVVNFIVLYGLLKLNNKLIVYKPLNQIIFGFLFALFGIVYSSLKTS